MKKPNDTFINIFFTPKEKLRYVCEELQIKDFEK